MNLLADQTHPHSPEPDTIVLSLRVPHTHGNRPLWTALFTAHEEDHYTWSAPILSGHQTEQTDHPPAAQIRADEGRAEAMAPVTPSLQAGPTRPGGTEAAHSVTAGKDRPPFPDGAGFLISMAANEAQRRPMLLARTGEPRVSRQPAPAARRLGPCHPVYFCSLAPYRPNRAEQTLRLSPIHPGNGPENTFTNPE